MKYFKPYIPYILAAVVLLFVEAMLELALPGYMADIIDDGGKICKRYQKGCVPKGNALCK